MAKITNIHVSKTDNEIYLLVSTAAESSEIVHIKSGYNDPVVYNVVPQHPGVLGISISYVSRPLSVPSRYKRVPRSFAQQRARYKRCVRPNLFCALRCIASQQAKTGVSGSSCARISTPPREARVGDPGPAAQGIVLAAACTARLPYPAREKRARWGPFAALVRCAGYGLNANSCLTLVS
jgi:hypothetical protein